jgi:hypothetical protein
MAARAMSDSWSGRSPFMADISSSRERIAELDAELVGGKEANCCKAEDVNVTIACACFLWVSDDDPRSSSELLKHTLVSQIYHRVHKSYVLC